MQKILSVPLLHGLAVIGTLSGTGVLAAQDVSATELRQIQQMIEELDEKLNGGAAKNNARALETLQSLARSPKAAFEFYMDAVKEIDFEQTGKRESDWREWRERNEDRLKSSEHMAALQYQARYLLMTVQVALEKDPEVALQKALPELIDYLDELAGNFKRLEGEQRVLSGSVLNSMFAKKLKLDLTLPPVQDWTAAPLPVSSVYDQVVLPFFRRAENHAALQAAWDKRILHESQTLAMGARGMGAPGLGGGFGSRRFGRDQRDREREERREETRQQQLSEDEFRTGRMPELQWGKQLDAYEYGNNPGASLLALGRILRENLTHTSAQEWLKELKVLAKGGSEDEEAS